MWPSPELLARVDTIQQRNFDLLQRGGAALMGLLDAVKKAKEAGVSEQDLNEALEFQRKAQWRLDFIAAENSMGFHSPPRGSAYPWRGGRLCSPGRSLGTAFYAALMMGRGSRIVRRMLCIYSGSQRCGVNSHPAGRSSGRQLRDRLTVTKELSDKDRWV